MSELDRLTAAQLRDAAAALGEWSANRRHDAEVETELMDEDDARALREMLDGVETVRTALAAEAAQRETAAIPKV